MSAPIDRVKQTLEAHGCRGRGSSWQCPAHDDRRASLSVSEGRDGRALLKCHAGCELDDILAALGLEERDLFPEGREERRVVATYPYVDENGELLFEVVRFYPKDFRQRRPDGHGGWTWNLDGTRRVLYSLPRVLNAVRDGATVYVVEGEKDVHALEGLGLVATTNPGGAGKWRAEFSEALRGAHVAVIADRDEAGRHHAREVARSLEGVAEKVTLLEPPAPHKDVSDLLAAGGRVENLVALSEEGGHQGNPVPDLASVLDEVLEDIEAYIVKYVYFPSPEQVVPLVLLVPVCYALLGDGSAVPAAPYVSVTSPAPECGKSRLLEVLHKLLGDDRAMFVAGSMTPATLYRSREERPIVLLVDEVGRLFSRRDDVARELVAILDSGYRRGATVPRAVPVGKDFVVRRWPVFGPAVLAGLGDLADTTRSRCIPIVLQRRPQHARVSPFFEDEAEPAAAAIRARLEAAAPALASALRARRPDISALAGLRDRTIETWRGLLAVADLAGSDWPARARAAALALHAGGDAEALDRGTLLLRALREVFDEAGADRLPTSRVLEALVEREGEPWPARWGQEVEAARDRGRPARRAASELARMLKGFGVKPAVIKMADGSTPRGYRREHLERPWAAYLGDPRAREGGDATDATNATALASEVASVASVASGPPDGGAEAAITAYLADHGGATVAEILGAVEGRGEALAAALGSLLSVGLVTREGDGRPGDPYRYALGNGEQGTESAGGGAR